MSVVQYQVGVMRTTSSPPLFPTMMVRCAATVPAAISPARIDVVSRATAISPETDHSSIGRPAASASSASDGLKLAKRWDARFELYDSGGRPKPI